MREIADVLTTVGGPRTEQLAAQRDREVFPNRTGKKFYCCPKCTSKLHECVSAKVFRYVDNAKWKTEIESDRKA